MIRGMTGRGDGLQAPSIAGHHVAISKFEIGIEFAVPASVKAWRFVEVELARSAMRPLTDAWRARCSIDAHRCGGVVAVSMRNQDVRDGFVANSIEQRIDMRLVKRPRVDDGNTIAADNITARSLEGERSGIVAKQPAHARIDFFDLAGG